MSFITCPNCGNRFESFDGPHACSSGIPSDVLFPEFNGYNIPERIQRALHNYIHNRIRPNTFLIAVLSNDLYNAIKKSTNEEYLALTQICNWVYRNAPMICWGDEETVKNWLKS